MRERFHVKIARHAEMDLEEIWDYIAADSVGNPQKVQIVHEESIWYGTACASKRVISRKLPGRWRDRFRTVFVSSTFWAKPFVAARFHQR